MKRVYTQDERYEINRVMDKAFRVMETTSNHIDVEIGILGVRLHAKEEDGDEFVIFDDAAFDGSFTRADADRMIAELEVLSHFNRFSDTKQSTADQDDAPEKEL